MPNNLQQVNIYTTNAAGVMSSVHDIIVQASMFAHKTGYYLTDGPHVGAMSPYSVLPWTDWVGLYREWNYNHLIDINTVAMMDMLGNFTNTNVAKGQQTFIADGALTTINNQSVSPPGGSACPDPIEVTVTEAGYSYLTVNWVPTGQFNNINGGYYVVKYKEQSSEDWIESARLSYLTNAFTLHGLRQATAYQIKVCGYFNFSQESCGDICTEVTAATEGYPLPTKPILRVQGGTEVSPNHWVGGSITPTSVTLEWDSQMHLVRWELLRVDGAVEELTPNIFSKQETELQPNTTYTFKITVVTLGGRMTSDECTFTTPFVPALIKGSFTYDPLIYANNTVTLWKHDGVNYVQDQVFILQAGTGTPLAASYYQFPGIESEKMYQITHNFGVPFTPSIGTCGGTVETGNNGRISGIIPATGQSCVGYDFTQM
jgi:hypothetical protein